MEKTNNSYKVMIVEDSPLIRGYLQRTLLMDPDIDVCAVAENGQIALDIVKRSNPDIILLDVEMPVMDGLTALPQLIKESPSSAVIMVSTLTSKNAAISIEALSKGASDYVEKPSADIDKEEFKRDLISKVKAIGDSIKKKTDEEFNFLNPEKKLSLPEQFSNIKTKSDTVTEGEQLSAEKPVEQKAEYPVKEVAKSVTNLPERKSPVKPIEVKSDNPAPQVNIANNSNNNFMNFMPDVLAIGCSTGGPQALQEVFGIIGNSITKIPIFITQHMPPQFTTFLAKSISSVSGAQCIEAEDGQKIERGVVYLAPGDFHMVVKNEGGHKIVKLTQDEPENFCRPAVDPMLRSLVDVYSNRILTVIMTGMGQDGLKGAKAVHEKGGRVIIQDEASSVVWGMPGAIANAGFHDAVYPLNELGTKITKICNGGL